MRRIIDRSHTFVLKSGKVALIGLAIAGWSPGKAHASELAYGVGYFGEYSDNIRRSSSDPVHEWVNSAIAGVVYVENGPALDAHLLAQAEYRDYANNIYADGPFYYADASLLWRILPQRLNWVFVDRYSQITRDARISDTPDNRLNANVLDTGPDLFIRLGQVNTLEFGLRYGHASYGAVAAGEGGQDNDRYGASARWLYAANAQTTFSLNYETVQVDYVNNDPLIEDFLRQDYFVRVDLLQSRARFRMDLGATQIDRDRSRDTSGNLARLDWSQQLTSGSTAGITLAREYLDAETVLLSTATSPSPTPVPGAPSVSSAPSEITNDFFYTKRIEAYYNRNDSIFRFNGRIFYRDFDYEVSPQDRQETGGLLDVTYDLSSVLAATAFGRYTDIEYLGSSRHDQESELGLRFLYRINPVLSASLEARKTWRYSTDAFQEFSDGRILCSFVYSTSPLFAPSRR